MPDVLSVIWDQCPLPWHTGSGHPACCCRTVQWLQSQLEKLLAHRRHSWSPLLRPCLHWDIPHHALESPMQRELRGWGLSPVTALGSLSCRLYTWQKKGRQQSCSHSSADVQEWWICQLSEAVWLVDQMPQRLVSRQGQFLEVLKFFAELLSHVEIQSMSLQ